MRTLIIRNMTIFSILACLSSVSCLWSQKKWNSLENRTFYFNKIKYVHKGSNEKQAFYFMKNAPVGAIAKLLEKKYSIKVDTSEFTAFIKNKKPDDLFIFRLLHKEEFSWVGNKKKESKVELYYSITFDDETDAVTKTYKLLLISDKFVRAMYLDTVNDSSEILENLTKKIK